MLLFTLLCGSTAYIYAGSEPMVVVLFTLFGAGYAFLLFAVYEALRRLGKPAVTVPAVLALLAAALFLGLRLFETDPVQTTQWVLEPQNMYRVYAGNIAALLLIGGAVLGSALYYFTAIRYRAVFVFLICMCPFSLFAKTFTDIPVICIILIATLFFILMILKSSGDSAAYGTRSFLVFGAFVVVVASASAFLPKLESAPYREDFDELITGIQIGGAGGTDFNGFSNASAYSTSDDDETVLFRVYGENPGLIKRQCFNIYRSGTDQWEYYGESDTGYNNFGEYLSWEDPAALSAEVGLETPSEEAESWLYSERGNLRALYTPENMTALEIPEGSPRELYRTPMDEYFVSSGNAARGYRIAWSRAEVDERFSRYYTEEVARENSSNPLGADYYKSYSEMKTLYTQLMTEELRRGVYKSERDYERVRELAASITENCGSDYEKARAIEAYFHTSAFVYDDGFSPADGSVENFIFHTKRGVCADYATAMALLCREVGLYSRYVEGFRIQRADPRGHYYVTAADSHAYVQVWINGYGWTDFDPTSNIVDGGYRDYTFLIFGGTMLLLGLTVGAVLLLRPWVRERRFLRRAGRLRGREQVLLLFPRVNRLMHEKLGAEREVYTPRELTDRVMRAYEIDLSPFTENYERAAYGGKEAEALDYLALYRALGRELKRAEREQRKKKG